MVLDKDPDDFAYDQHLKNIHADETLVARVKKFREDTEVISHALAPTPSQVDMIMVKEFDPDFEIEESDTDDMKDTRALPKYINPETLFVPVRLISYSG